MTGRPASYAEVVRAGLSQGSMGVVQPVNPGGASFISLDSAATAAGVADAGRAPRVARTICSTTAANRSAVAAFALD
jgi:hypothetical protein